MDKIITIINILMITFVLVLIGASILWGWQVNRSGDSTYLEWTGWGASSPYQRIPHPPLKLIHFAYSNIFAKNIVIDDDSEIVIDNHEENNVLSETTGHL